jgi:hypothetical protein
MDVWECGMSEGSHLLHTNPLKQVLLAALCPTVRQCLLGPTSLTPKEKATMWQPTLARAKQLHP